MGLLNWADINFNGIRTWRMTGRLDGNKDHSQGAGTLYKSVVRDGQFLVLVCDGIFDTPLMELPTEELADRVAYELQSAWDEGVASSSCCKPQGLNGDGYDINISISEVIQKLKSMSLTEREAYLQRLNRRNERVQKVEEVRRWRDVLSWKSK